MRRIGGYALAGEADALSDHAALLCEVGVGTGGAVVSNSTPQNQALAVIEGLFHGLIRQTVRHLPLPARLPKLDPARNTAAAPGWFPVPGMYGGFKYWLLNVDGETTLHIESWNRVIQGSEQYHVITRRGVVLTREGED